MIESLYDYENTEKVINDYIASAVTESSVLNYAQMEFGRGLKYSETYIRRLGFKGERLLDAGCGVGNWTMWLAAGFKKVEALEFSRSRLEFCRGLFQKLNLNNITCQEGSIEDLPYEDESFDAIFCNGVIFLTDYQKSLKELYRVLKPGGKIYLSYDGLAWWNYLLYERGPNEPNLYPMVSQMLLNYAQHKLRDLDLAGHTKADRKLFCLLLLRDFWTMCKISGKNFKTHLKVFKKIPKIIFQKYQISSPAKTFSDLYGTTFKRFSYSFSKVLMFGTADQQQRLWDAFFNALNGESIPPDRGTSFEIDEMEEELRRAGFIHMVSESEGVLTSGPCVPESLYKREWGVYETVAIKPENPLWIIENKVSPFFPLETTSKYNCVAGDSAEIILGREWQKLAKFYNEKEVLEQLTKTLTSNCKNDKEKFLTIYHFLQDHFYHHPTFQLMVDKGQILTDALPLLATGIARCGAIAAVAQKMYQALGYEAKVTQLFKHVCCEVKFNDKWLVVDPDFFKAGLYPYNRGQEWASLQELQASPDLLNEIPAVGFILSPYLSESRCSLNKTIEGYTDSGFPWNKPYSSYLYFGIQETLPVPPPQVSIKRTDDKIIFTLEHLDPRTENLEIAIDPVSRGWHYRDRPSLEYLKRPQGKISFLKIEKPRLKQAIEVSLPRGKYFINFFARNSYEMTSPKTYVWPGDEIYYQDKV
jgi:ubiquinone/menaquinone biosynthesis C-methylase UbiE